MAIEHMRSAAAQEQLSKVADIVASKTFRDEDGCEKPLCGDPFCILQGSPFYRITREPPQNILNAALTKRPTFFANSKEGREIYRNFQDGCRPGRIVRIDGVALKPISGVSSLQAAITRLIYHGITIDSQIYGPFNALIPPSCVDDIRSLSVQRWIVPIVVIRALELRKQPSRIQVLEDVNGECIIGKPLRRLNLRFTWEM